MKSLRASFGIEDKNDEGGIDDKYMRDENKL